MQESTVTIKGQTTLPKDVRKVLQLHPGDLVRYMILDGGEVRLVRLVRSQPVARLAGMLQSKTDRRVSLEAMEEALSKGAVDKLSGSIQMCSCGFWSRMNRIRPKRRLT